MRCGNWPCARRSTGSRKPSSSRDHEPALTGLDVDDEPLEPIAADEHLLGVPRAPIGRARSAIETSKTAKATTDDDREQAARDDHPASEPLPHVLTGSRLEGYFSGWRPLRLSPTQASRLAPEWSWLTTTCCFAKGSRASSSAPTSRSSGQAGDAYGADRARSRAYAGPRHRRHPDAARRTRRKGSTQRG